MKFVTVAAALTTALVPSYASRRPAMIAGVRRNSAPALQTPNPGNSIAMLSDEDTAILLAAAAKHRNHPVAGIETIYSARYSGDAAKVLVFAFSKNCLVDRGAIPIDEWEKIFGPADLMAYRARLPSWRATASGSSSPVNKRGIHDTISVGDRAAQNACECGVRRPGGRGDELHTPEARRSRAVASWR